MSMSSPPELVRAAKTWRRVHTVAQNALAKPLQVEHHVILTEGEGILIEVERLPTNVHGLRHHIARGRDALPVRHDHREIGIGLKADARALRHVDVDEVVGRP
jgi:hypothetical protein